MTRAVRAGCSVFDVDEPFGESRALEGGVNLRILEASGGEPVRIISRQYAEEPEGDFFFLEFGVSATEEVGGFGFGPSVCEGEGCDGAAGFVAAGLINLAGEAAVFSSVGIVQCVDDYVVSEGEVLRIDFSEFFAARAVLIILREENRSRIVGNF